MFRKYTFRGGVHPSDEKYWTEEKTIEKMPLPEDVVLPLQQHIGAPSEPIVQKGEPVKTGQLIAKATKYVSVPLHATVSGTVKSIETLPHPLGNNQPAIVIQSDGNDTWYNLQKEPNDYRKLSSVEIKNRILDAGIAGLGGAAFPAHVKLSVPPQKSFDTVILNGAECEPYLTSDHRLMLERSEDVVSGLKIILRLLNVKRGYIGIEKNKPDAIQAMQKAVSKSKKITLIPLNVKYPQGAEKQLIKAVTGREVPSGGLPVDVSCLVHNVGTAVSIYEAVVFQKPLIERVVTVSGAGIKSPKNLLVRLGTRFSELIKFCDGCETSVKIINGGPMMGIAQVTDQVPVIKGTSGILILPEKQARLSDEGPCIGCARCVDTCPMKLIPTQIAQLVKHDRIEGAHASGLMDCMECGTCAYICPAKINLVHYIKLGKAKWQQKKRDTEKAA